MQAAAVALREGSWLGDLCRENEATLKEHVHNVQKAFYSYFNVAGDYTYKSLTSSLSTSCLRNIQVTTNGQEVHAAAEMMLTKGGGILHHLVWNDGALTCEQLAINGTQVQACNTAHFQGSLLSNICGIRLLDNSTITLSLPKLIQSGSSGLPILAEGLKVGVTTLALYKTIKNLTTGHKAYAAAWLVSGVLASLFIPDG